MGKNRIVLLVLTVILFAIALCSCQTAHEHNYQKTVINATCTENGYDKYVCECSDSYTDNTVMATGHEFTDYTVKQAAGCSQPPSRRHGYADRLH